ncbi:MAG: GspE/PulE family protein [Patescibacteria group bacterium]
MTDQEFLKELVKRKLIDQGVAGKIEQDAKFLQRSAEDLLYERRLIDETSAAKVKSELLGAPYKKIIPESIHDDLLKIIPRETSMTYRVIPIEKTDNMLVVGMLRPDDERAAEALRFIAKREGLSLGVYLVTPSDMTAVWRRYASYRTEIEAAVKEIGVVLGGGEMERRVALEEGGTSEEAPIIKIVASTLRQAVDLGVSDIHIEPQRARLRIRFRIDGELQEVASVPSSLAQPIVSRVKVLARLKLDENRTPQDGRFRTAMGGRDIDYRVATFPTPAGEKVAIRVLDPATGLKSADQLGLNEYNAAILKEAVNRPYGMILLSGPTGSGKTTTLYAILQSLSREAINIVTLEDPVEYFIESVNQSQVKPEIGYTFASGLRQILRQDPDVIMVGEIRDGETASLAVNAALTGHIMLSTIHTNNSISVIPRLIDLGVPPFLLSSALNLMMAQRLVLRLCQNCRKEIKAPPEIEKIIDEGLKELPVVVKKDFKYKSPYSIYRAEPKADCKICKGKGTVGRIAIYELFQMTRELGDLINIGFSQGKLLDEAKRQGMINLRTDGILKALDGSISIEEVLRETV